MRKINTLLIALFILTCTSCSIEKSENSISSKKKSLQVVAQKKNDEKRNTYERHKKGIEHIADYQNEIRKPINAKVSSYKKGYIFEEFKKAKQGLVQFKSSKKKNSLTPVFNERGPANVPGRTRGIAVDPNNNQRWFLGTVSGGIWLTENEGETWVNLTDTQIPNLSTSTIVMSPQDSNTLYVGTGEPFGNLGAVGGSGMFKTIDGGATWISLTSTASFGDVGRIIINPNDKNNVLIATKTGIYRTTDGGVNWNQTYSSSGWVQDLDADPTDFKIQFGSVRNFGVVKSIDGGITWSVVFDKSSFNESHQRFELAISQADSNFLYVSVYSASGGTTSANSDFYLSTDKGTNFTLLTTESANSNLLTGQGWYDNIIMGHPFDTNAFYVGGVAIFKVTVTNNVFSFKSIASGYDNGQINLGVHVDQHGLETILGENEEFRILVANDGGIYSTTFNSNPGFLEGNWSSTVTGKNSTQFYGATKQNGEDNYIAGAQDNGSWISLGSNSDKTKTYQKILGGDGFEVLWHYNKPGNFLATSQRYGGIGRYIDYSGSLTSFPDAGDSDVAPFYAKLSNVDNNPDVVFAISGNGVWRSTDFGGNWSLSAIPNNFTSRLSSSSLNVEPSIANPNIVWAGAAMTESGNSVLHVSQDNGKTFSPAGVYESPNSTHNLRISGIGISSIEEKRAYALFSSQGAAKVLKTEDLGQTWVDISGFANSAQTGFPDVAVHSILEMPFDKNILWVGTDIGIFETLDSGANWHIVANFIPVAVYDLKIVNNQVIISTYGRGVWSATLSELNSYTLPVYFTSSEVSVNQKGIESNKAIVNYNVNNEAVSRIKIFIDDVEKAEIVQDFNTGVTYNFETLDLPEGSHKVAVQLFNDTNNTQTFKDNIDFTIVDFKSASSFLKITAFTASDVFAYNEEFVIDNLSNKITTNALNNSEHPYANNTTYSVVLKQPLTISASNKNFMYEDFAIVEPYTDDLNDLSQFYDYVIIEASTDLNTWKTLDKYDSRRYSDWLLQYGRTEELMTINDALFKEQSIDLTTKGFLEGETIVLRFSLVSDPFTTSYGWAIRSINKEATASVDDVLAGLKVFTIYPTVSNGSFTIQAKNEIGNTKMTIFDIRGREVFKKQIDFSVNEKQDISVNLKGGVYMVHIRDENNKKSSNKIIIE